jgi:hypothetical protein
MPIVCSLLLRSIALSALCWGCTTPGGVSLRPDGTPGPQDCAEEAQKAMRYVRLHVGDSAIVQLDANQVGSQRTTLYEGPVESVLEEDFGTLTAPARLYGRVWTSGPQVVIRYFEAHPVDGDKVPICAVARLSYDQMKKSPDSKPGMAILEGSVVAVFVVDAFR